MSNTGSQYGIVNLENVRQNNIVYIDLGQKLTESIFEHQYKMAAKIIAGIIRESDSALKVHNGYCRDCRRSDCEACIHRDRSHHQGEIKPKQNLTSFHTAVPFIGDRGTGKTSVMYSVWERLRNYYGFNPEAAFYLGPDFNNVKFIALDMIDAGMLKTTDDVMEIILAQMLGYLEDLRADHDFRELYRQIDELHEDLCLVRVDKEGKREEYGLTGLQRVADSRNAVCKFQALVKEFIQMMSIHKFNRQPCYLVIALDDIDMYQGSAWGMKNTQFALLEHIYCHLRIPGLIVLMTYNEHLLKRSCNRHFEEIYFGRRIERPYTPTEQQDIENLTAQFMSKLFPQEKRIYMPNFLLVDALDRPNLYICPMLDRQPLAPFQTGEAKLPVKEFMLRLIAYKTGVYFDAAGTKKHFFEPRNLRDLGELFQFVDSMEPIPKHPEQQKAVGVRNRQALLDYLKNHFALRYLDAEEYEQFEELMKLPLWRQDRTLVDKIRLQRQTVAKMSDDFGYLSGPKEDRWRYSYGELLHNIYFSTRIYKNQDSRDPFFRKEFMHCIFGTHSVQMNEAVRSTQSRQDMLKVIGSSLAGRWANSMLPKIRLTGYEKYGSASAGSLSLPVRDFFGWQIPEDAQKAIFECCDENCADAEVLLSKFMEAMVIAGMFFTNIPAQGLGIQLDVDTDDEGTPVLCMCSNCEGHVCFNVLNFAINMYDALPDENTKKGGYLPFMKEKLSKLGREFTKQMKKAWDKEYQEAKSVFDKLNSDDIRNRKLRMEPSFFSLRDRQLQGVANMMEHAEQWMKLQSKYSATFDPDAFQRQWNAVLQKVISKYEREVAHWRINYGQYQWVLPVQNFDMMYNINKRLANVSYHDIADDVNVSDVFADYIRLYHSMAEELQKQDEFYFGSQSGRFSKALQDCIFYTAITASERSSSGKLNKKYNAYIEEILVSMIASPIRAQVIRKEMGAIPL